MPLIRQDMVRALARAGERYEAVVLCGSWENEEEAYYAGLGDSSDYCAFHNAKSPEEAVDGLFDEALREGLIERADFDLTTVKLPLYLLNEERTSSTIRWLRLFTTGHYLRIPYPTGEEPLDIPVSEGFRFEFAIKATGGPDTAGKLLEFLRNS